MKITTSIAALSLTLFLASCTKLEDKSRQVSNKVKSKSKHFARAIVNEILVDETPEIISIDTVVEDFKNGKKIIETKGIRLDSYFSYRDYFVYRAKKERVLRGVNRIKPQKSSGIVSDSTCHIVTPKQLYDDTAPYEKSKYTAFFWGFEQLKSYEIYSCVKAPWQRYVIFDNNSDTVYHRREK